jgi:hypothetical protein
VPSNYRSASRAAAVFSDCLKASARASYGILFCIFAASLAWAQNSETTLKCPPPTRLDSAKDTYGTTVVPDPYRWLENQESPETRAWIDAQQRCTEAALSKVPGRSQISNRLTEIYNTDSYEVPGERGGRFFLQKRPEGHGIYVLLGYTFGGAKMRPRKFLSIHFRGAATIHPASLLKTSVATAN